MAPAPQTLEQRAEQLRALLTGEAARQFGAGTRVENLRKMTAGASRETWAFDAATPAGDTLPLILKRDPLPDDASKQAKGVDSVLGVDRLTEGRLIELARAGGVPAPRVHFYLAADRHGSNGFVMDRLDGETLGRRIARDDAFAGARTKLAYQCGEAAARIHAVPRDRLPPLKELRPRPHLQLYRDTLDGFGYPHAGFEYGLRWLEERIELAGGRHTLTHGDFRNGNLMVGPDGLRGVLDWELGHIGDPMCDLGWICLKSWRFGEARYPVGGFGRREDLFAGYEAASGLTVDPAVVHFWEVFGAARWGIMCMIFVFGHLSGRNRSVETATIGRRAAEAEFDLLELVD